MNNDDDDKLDAAADDDDALCTEKYYFGHLIGEIEISQMKSTVFNESCLQSNSNETDSTGLRLHAGAHIEVRFLAKYGLNALSDKLVIELGSGTGVVSLTIIHKPKILFITDGDERSRKTIERNNRTLGVPENICMKLTWGNDIEIENVLKMNQSQPFDVILGSELLYYRTDVSQLIKCIISLSGSRTIFIHSHVIRMNGQGQLLADGLKDLGLFTYEMPVEDIVGEEIKDHPEFFSVRCLITVSNHDLLHEMFGDETKSKFIPFIEDREDIEITSIIEGPYNLDDLESDEAEYVEFETLRKRVQEMLQ